jgi:PAS domain S-box-containing protein
VSDVSKIKGWFMHSKSEDTGKKTNEILERMFSTTYLMIAYLDANFDFISVNQAYAESAGHDPDFFMGKNHFDLYPDPENEAIFRQVLETGVAYSARAKPFEYKDHPGRGITYWNWDLHPIEGISGKADGLLLCLVDVTERVNAEKALRDYQDHLEELVKKRTAELERSQRQYKMLFDSTPDGVIAVNPEGDILSVNPAGAKILGYERPEELLGKNAEDLYLNPADRQALLDAVTEKGFLRNYGMEVIKKDGSSGYLMSSIVTHKDEEGNILTLEAIFKDMTQQRLAMTKLREDRNHLADIVDERTAELREADEEIQKNYDIQKAMNSLMEMSLKDTSLEDILEHAIDTPLSIPWFSSEPRAAFFLVEDESDELVMKACRGFSEEQQEACKRIPFGKCLCGLAASMRELQFVDTMDERYETKYEGLEPHGCYVVPVLSYERVIGVINLNLREGHQRDEKEEEFLKSVSNVLAGIIDRKRMEEELIEERASLAQRVQQQTMELRAANAELARADRMKDEFMAAMSHELRTPISGILGMTEVLRSQVYGPLNEEQLDSLSSIEGSGQHLLNLINDILDISKIEVGQLELNLEWISPKDVCEASLRFIERGARMKRLKISSSFDSAVTMIHADERRLKQILVNLLSNAVKFTPEGGAVGLEVIGDSEEERVDFTVWDTGIGIPESKMALLFEPFVQLDSKLSRQHSGTGLGLALVQRLARMHDGSISVESEEGKGSRFTFSLPWEAREHLAEKSAKADSISLEASDVNLALLVEDSHSAAEQISGYLSRLGTEVIVSSRGNDALEKAVKYKPGLVILDIILPDISGWSVLSKLKEDQRTKHVPVLVVSVIDDRPRGAMLGADEYLVKPISRQEFRQTLGRLFPRNEGESKVLLLMDNGPPGFKQPVILLAEDNEMSIKSISTYLSASGAQIIVARNGKEAIQLVKENSPDLILMDIQMPDVDGLEAIRSIRDEPDATDIPIIALTALAMPGDREKCLDAGADDYISKPVGMKTLVRSIQKQLDRPRNPNIQ